MPFAATGDVVQRLVELSRISEISGVDLDDAYGRGLAWLAWLHRRGGTNP